MAVARATAACFATAPLPMDTECFLPIGCTVQTSSAGIGANSAWSAIAISGVLVG